MSSIDKRIVQMQFDNQNFESGVSKTMSTLQKLNEKLKMKDSTSGLQGINKGINSLSSSGLSGLASGVSAVTAKFSTLGVIGVTALANITNKAIDAGTRIAKSLTIDPIMQGFSEYELKMGSIQTILANTAHQGTTIDDVNKVLNELNTYADKTIYNFAEMTRNIGTFTAAGVDLDTSTAAIKGIANLAAISGSNSQQASTAMYQLSQALAAGRVSLADWNSVVNAGMGGKVFQDALIRTSEQLGTGAEKMIEKYGSFRESLTQGEWLTSEVLTETLKQLSGAYTEADLIAQGYTESQAKQIMELAKTGEAAATEVKTVTQLMDTMKESVQSGWAQSWEYILGDKDQATKLLTSISDGFNNIIGPSTEARNAMLKFWNENGGRDDVIKGFTNIFQSLGKGFKSIGEAWKEVFPSMTGEKLVELSEKFKNFTEKLKMSDKTAGKIKNTFKGVFNVFKTVGSAIGSVIKAFSPLLGIFKPLGSGLLTVTSGLGQFITKIADAANKSKIFSKVADGIKSAFESIGKFLGNAGSSIGKFFGNLDFSNIGSALSKAFSGIGKIIAPIGEGVGKALGSINFNTLSNFAKSLVGLGIFKSLKNIFDEFKGVGEGLSGVFDSFSGIGEGITDVLDTTRDSLTAWQNSLNSGTLIKLASAIGILAASLVVLSSIDPGSLATALAGMAGLFAEMSLAMLAINKIGDIKGLTKTSIGLILLSTAMLILSNALQNLSELNIGEMLTGLVGVGAMLGIMTAAVKIFNKSAGDLAKTSIGLIIFGAAMQVMAGALRKLGEIDTETLGAGLFSLASVMAEIVIFSKLAGKETGMASTAIGLAAMAGAMLVLSAAMKSMGSIQWEEIARGMIAMAGGLSVIGIASDVLKENKMVSVGVGIAAMSASLLLLSAAMHSISGLSWEEIARGIVAMAGGLAVLGVATSAMSELQMISLSVGIAAMSASLLLLSAAMKSMASMSWDEIARGLIVLGGALLILGVAMNAMTEGIVGAAAMLVMAGALAILTPQLLLLGQMNLTEIGSALLALAGAFTVIGLAGLILTPLAPFIALLGAGIALLGAGCLAAATGMSLFATGFALIGATISASGTIILNFIQQLIQQLPLIGIKAAEGFANFMGAISTAVPQITSGMTAIGTAILTALTTLIPQIVDTGVKIVVSFAQGLASAVPELVSAGMELVVGVLEGVAANIGQLVQAGADIIVNFLNGVAGNLGSVIEAGINLALSFVEGVANGISSNSGRLESAIRSVIQAMAQAGLAVIKGSISGFTSGGKQLLQGFCNGVKSMMSSAGSAVKSCIDSAKRSASNLGSALVSAGKNLIQGLVNGITSMASSVAEKARSVVQGAIDAAKNALGIHSPSRVFMEIGKFTTEGLAIGLDRHSNSVTRSAASLADGVIENVRKPLSNMAKILSGDIDANPVITPVMDLSNIKNGARQLNGMLGNGTQINTASSLMASSIGQIQNGNNNDDVVSALKDLKSILTDTNNTTYQINGITYDDGSNVTSAVETLVRAAKIERRI